MKQFYVQLPDYNEGEVWDEEKYNRNQEQLMKDHSDAMVYEMSPMTENDDILDGDSFNVQLPGYDAEQWDAGKLKRNRAQLMADHPDVQIMRFRPTGTWGDNVRKEASHAAVVDRLSGNEPWMREGKAWEDAEAIRRKRDELARQLEDYDKKATKELDAIPGQQQRQMKKGEQEKTRGELRKQIRELDEKYYNSNAVLQQRQYGKDLADKANKELDEMMAPELEERKAREANRSPFLVGASYGVGGNAAVPSYNESLYTAAKNLNDDTYRMYDAPGKYGKEKGFDNFMKGAKDRVSTTDFWTMGLTGIADQYQLKGVLDKVGKELGGMKNLTEENINEVLSPMEQQLLAAFFRNADAQASRAEDMSRGYQAGQSAADSLQFMAQFALSGGATAGATKALSNGAVDSFAGLIAKWIGKGSTNVARQAIAKGVGAVAESAVNMALQPGTIKSVFDQQNQFEENNKYGDIVDQKKAVVRGLADYLIENVSERSGELLNGAMKKVGGKVAASEFGKRMADTPFAQWGKAFYNSDQIKLLRAGGWNGYFGEMSEELIGDALRTITGVEPEALKKYGEADTWVVLATSFLPMTLFGGAMNTAKYGYTKKQYNTQRPQFEETLSNLGFSEEQISHATDLSRMSSPEDMGKTLGPIIREMAERGASKEDLDLAFNFAQTAAAYNIFDEVDKSRVQEQRNAALGELTEAYGDFWQGNNEDERTVERVTLPDGRSGYVLDTDETGMMSVKWDDGSVSFTDAEHGAQTGLYSLDQYLDGIILTEDRAREAASMQEEEMQGRQELAQKIEANESVPMGTDEAPVNGTYVGRDQQGNNIIQLPDGQTLLSDEELAAKWGINIQPKTEEQKEADATAEYEAMQMRKNAYNTIPRGAEVEAHLEGLDQPVKYKFTRALYDEDEQELKIFVEDENGEEKSLPESAFPDLSLAASQYSQQQEIAEEQTPAAEAQQDVPRDFRGNPLPLKADGSVNQTDLWNNDPEAWAAWNDSQRRDGGANSRNYVQAAVNTVQSEIEAAQKQYAKELDFDKREAIEKQIADKQNRLNTLNGVLSGYNAREEAAKNSVEEAAVQQEAAALAEQEMTPEQAAEAAAAEAMRIEAERQKPLEERAKAWEERTGQKVTVIHNFDEVPESEVTARASLRLGLPVTGWYSTSQGHVMLYVPNIKDESEIDKTYMHEVISHKGLREMLGKERFDELMDHTWNDIMSEADRKRFADYVQMTWPDAEGEALRRAAADEYIANLAENIDTNPTAWEKFVAKVKEILEKILGTELKITDADLKTLLQASLARYEAQAQEGNPEISARLSDVGIASTGDETRFSVKYAPKTEAEADSIAADIAAQVGVSKAAAKRWVKSETSLADIIGTKENQPYLDYTGDDRYTAIKENSDYPQGTVDFNNICRKRLAFTDMYQRIQKAFPNVIITGEDLAKIRNIMKSHGLTVACGLCYVEDRRQLLGEIAKDFIDNYNGNFEEYAARGGEAKKKNADKFRKLIGEDRKDDLSIYDLITLSGSAKLYEEHPGIYNAFQAFNNARGQQSGNLFQGYAEYKREILKWSKARVKRVNDNGGLRVFSYSDFEAHHLIDLVQIIQDCARKGVKIQGYTKVPAFARAVSETGIKLNRSLIPLGDTGIVDGKLAYDPVEGIDVNDPNFLESNDNIGNILIGINDEQIRLAMADPFVHYIIPYHSNQREVLRSLKQTGAWTNYKPYQNEKDASGKTTLLNIYTDVIAAAEAEGKPIKTEKQFTEKFLQVCEENGLTPRFEQFLDRKGGKYVYTPGYYKLLLDFKMFDENGKYLPQNPVVAKFDDAFNAQILNDYVKGEKEKFDGNLDDVYNEIVESLGLAGREQDVQPKTGDQILGEILESIDRKNAGQEEAQAENESEEMLFRKGDPSTEEGNTFFRISDGTLVGLHNISEEKLRKADKAGGLANPSAAVIDITKQEHNNFGEISLVMPSAMVSATSGKNGGTYLGDAWTPTFPMTQKKMSKAGSKAFDKQIMALPADVRYNVENAFENYLEEDRDGNALRWWFLNETGRNPAIIHHESPYSKEDAKTIEGISEWDLKDEDIRTLADLYRKYASEEDVQKATTKFDPKEGSTDYVRRRMQEYNDEIDKYGIHLSSVRNFLRQAKDQIRQDGRLDDYRTMDSARQFIEDNNLGEEFRSWLEGKEEEFGVETKLFAGWDRNGYKKWIDYTAENASKLMNKESGRNAYSDNGLSATHGLLVRKMRTLAEIRKNKDLLVTRAEYDERYDQVDNELHSAISVLDGMQKISDNPFTNYDYTASRLQEALTHTNPAAYLNSEYKYSIPEDGEYAQQLEKLRKDIMEMPVNYFETKFNRPVGLSEFTSAVVPSNLDEKTRKILEDAGVTMFEYDPNQEGSRRDATMRATEQEGIRFRVANENQRIFVSNAEKAVEEMKMDKATPEQWKKTLEKNGGLKAAEDKWLGLSTWLDGLDRKTVTKQEILDFIAENQIKIEEQRYAEAAEQSYGKAIDSYQEEYARLVDEGEEAGEFNAFVYAYDQMVERYGDDFEMAFSRDGNTITPDYDYGGDFSDAARYFLDQRRGETDVRGINTTRLGYTTEGLTNRQEIALTIPTIEPWNESDKIHFGDAGEGRAISWARFGDTWTSKAKDEAEKEYRKADRAFRDYRKQIIAKYAEQNNGEADRAYWEFMRRFNDGHAPTREEQVELRQLEAARNAALPNPSKIRDLATPEENAKVKELQLEANRLYHEWAYGAHPREKVLVIDEIQSKRHQEGREHGYKDQKVIAALQDKEEEAKKAYDDYIDSLKEKYGGFNGMAGNLTEEENQRAQELNDAHIAAQNEVLDSIGSIPAAPFEKNWPELTMKRMLRYAAEFGYDTVAWTTGEQQAERYSLSTVVDKVSVRVPTNRDGERIVNLYLRQSDGDYKNMYVDKDGVIIHGEYAGQKLSAVVGMDLATKIMGVQEGRQEFEGEDLKVGGEGMKGFYDDILPRFMNKYGKKWGVKVEDIYLPALGEDAAAGVQKGLTMHSVPVTQEMKESVMQGQLMFRIGEVEEANTKQKLPGETEAENAPEDAILFRISNNNRATIESWLKKRNDLSDGERESVMDFIDKIDDAKTQLATGRWYANGTIRIPEDMDKVKQAVSVAGKAKVDPLRYSSPMELLNAHADFKPTAERINPDDVPTLHKAEEYPEGVVVYDVDEGKESRQNMRKIINTHFGEDASPWCLLQGDGKGNLTKESQRYWNHYNAYPKQAAFKDGKLLAFSANDSGTKVWWDRQDTSHYGIPITKKIEGDELGRSAVHVLQYEAVMRKDALERDLAHKYNCPPYRLRELASPEDIARLDEVNREIAAQREAGMLGFQKEGGAHLFKGNRQNGVYEEWSTDGETLLERIHYKDGKANGISESWYQNGQQHERATMKDDHYVGPVTVWHENGQVRLQGNFDEDAKKDGKHEGWFKNGNKRYEVNYDHGQLVGERREWYEDGTLATVYKYDDTGELQVHEVYGPYGIETRYTYPNDNDRIEERFYRGGRLASKERRTDGQLEGLQEYFFTDGAIRERANYHRSEKDGLLEKWHPNGQLWRRENWKDGKKEGIFESFDRNGDLVSRSVFHDGELVDGDSRNYMKPSDTMFRIAPEEEESAVRFRTVTDPLKIAELEAKPKVKVYRSMQEIDGKLYPPMSARVDGELRRPTELGVWEESEENPALSDENGDFKLDKGNGKSLKAAYAPYFHSRRSPLNEQFSEAYNRPNLVIVEGEIPESELTSGYTAEKSKKSVGEHDWPSGKVSNALAKKGQDTRKVILSRWFKPVRVVPNSEVADMIMERMGDSDISFPYNVVTPFLREELAKRGARFEGWQGNKPADVYEQIARMEAENDAVSDNGGDIRFSIRGINGAKNAKDEVALDNLDVAEEMERAGKDMPTIWRATGWEKGTDGKWRNEIPDAKLKEGVGLGIKHKAGEILDAPELFDSYPQIADYDVYIMKSSTAGGFNPNNNSITIDTDYNTAFDDGLRVLTDEGRRTLLHELQHAIQYVEGFATGGNKGAMEKRYYQEEAKKNLPLVTFAFNLSRRNSTARLLRAGRSEVIRQAENLDKSRFNKRDQEAFAELIEYLKGINDAEYASFAKKAARVVSAAKKAGEEGYHNLAGEVEARNVERRSKVPAKNRKQYAPSMSEDTPRDKQIVRFRLTPTTHLTEEQQSMVLTPQFKKWFGNWDIAAMTTPILSSKGTFKTLAEAEDWAKNNLLGRSEVNENTGEEIYIGRKSIDEFLYKDAQEKSVSVPVHLAAVQSVLDFIRTGIPGETHADNKGRGFDVLRLFNAFEYNGELYRVKSTVRKVKQGDRYYTYEVQEMELAEESRANRKGEGEDPHNPNTSDNSITGAKLLKGVKKYNSSEEILNYSKVVDEFGWPRIVYHGTKWNPLAEKPGKAVFDEDRVGENFDNVDIDWNFFFTASEASARGYGKAIPVFLNIRNPEVHTINERISYEMDEEIGHEIVVTAHDAGSEYDEVTRVDKPDGVMYTIRAIDVNEAEKRFGDAIKEWEGEHKQELEDEYNALKAQADDIYKQIEDEYRKLYDELGFQNILGMSYDEMKSRAGYVGDETVLSAAKLREGISTEKIDDLQKQFNDVDQKMFKIFQRHDIKGRPTYEDYEQLEVAREYHNSDIFALDNPNQIKSATANNGEFSTENNDIRFRITPEQDQEYMDAVNAGDMEKAGQMVRDAAALAMPNTKVVDKDGKPIVVYHGTPDMGFTVFAQPGEGFQGLIWMTDQKRYAEVYAEEYDGEGYPNEGAGVYSLFANIENPLDMGYIEDVVGSDSWNNLAEKLGMTPEELFNRLKRIDSFTYEDAQKRMMYIYDYTRDAEFANLLKEKGFDGAFALEEGINKTPTYAAVDPSQVKSADPVGYDDNGNVIPLSQRFNESNPDIRFRLAEQDTASDLVNQYDNQDGEEFPWMSERELMDRVQEEIPYGKDTEELYALIDRYNRLDEADLEEGRRDYSGSEKDDVFEEFLDALRQFADGEDHTLFKLGEQGEKPVRTADDLVKRVQDYGLRGILDEDAAKAFWADAYAVMPEDARREIIDATFGKDADKQDLDIRRQTRAYVADLAKKGYAEDESGLLRYLADKLKEELGQDLDENTLRYLIWRSAKRYASNNLLDLAEDIAIRRRLGVGEFNGEKFPTGTSEAMDEAEKRIDEAEGERDEARQATRRQARKTPYAALNSAMTAQRKYDQETVASVVALAKDMIKKGNIDKVSAREMARLMTIIKDANGRKPATVKAATLQLLDFMVDHTIGKEKELLDKVVKVRTAKVREPGVDTIAKLDLRAQNVVNSFRENYKLSEEEILRNISELEDKMADGRRTDASLEDMRSQLEGLNLALQYATEIGAKEADIRAIRQQMKDAKDEFDALSAEEKKKFRTSLNEELAAGEEMIRSKKIEEVDAYRRLRGDIAGAIDEGAERAKTFLEAERERVEQIHHWANSDLQGVLADVRDRNLTGWGKFANSSFAKLFTAPLANLDQMLRTLGRKTPEGRGYLWNWMMGAVRKASDDEKLGLDAAEKKLNDKVKEIFDDPKMEWNDLYSLERKMPKSKMTYFSANGEWVTEELTQGNLLYIYMVNKMTDGRMKLRQMNITEEDVQEIKKALDPRFVELADWVQEEFLPGLRDRYNETHKRLFGTSMASIENYFPLRILGGVIEEKRNVGDQEGKALPTDITGAIIKRTVNSKQLNLAGTDALSLVVEHLREMEHWNAYAEASRDFSTLLKYKRFQNQLKQLDTVYGAGKDLLDLFWDTVNLSVGAFRPKTTPTDKAFLNLAKGVTAAKISFRAYTAIKQILSWPAFIADTNPLILAKNTLPINWKKNWDWAMENLPNFKKRVESRKAGIDILEDTSLDSKFWGTDFAKWINQNGMFMNAFVDALTVSIGAKSVYETKKARYIEEGFSEEEADKKAKYDAEVAYNETQQSSEKEFMSTMQAHRTVANVALSAYRNSSMGYQRQLHQALRTLNRMSRKGYKQESIEYMTKQLEREGLSEADAKKAAEDRYKRAGYQALIRVAVFGWLVQFAWNLGAHAVYMLFGDDPDEKKAMLREDATHALIGGPIEGLAAGNIMSEAFNMIKNGENLRNWDPTTLPIMSDIKSTISKMSSDPVAGANDLVYLAAQIGLGTNPQTLSDAIVAIVDACDGDFETAREVMFCIMRILAVPQSQLDQLMIDEIGMKAKDARELSYEDVAKRYVDYKMKRNAPVTGKFYDEELRKKREKSLNTTFKKKYNERKKLKGEE